MRQVLSRFKGLKAALNTLKIGILLLTSPVVSAINNHALDFKKPAQAGPSLTYYILLGLLGLLALLFALKRYKPKTKVGQPQALIIEKMPINSKTQVYIIAYKDQQFLLADNQQALAIQALLPHGPHKDNHERP